MARRWFLTTDWLFAAAGIASIVLAAAGCSLALGYDDVAFKPNADAGAAGGPGVDPASPGECTPNTCAELKAECGEIDDGCGSTANCGVCADQMTCGGGGPNLCGAQECQPKSCAELGATCAKVSDGCTSMIDCGTCQAPETCGGGGTPNQCGCKKATCQDVGAQCGTFPDGCGGTLDCGPCNNGTHEDLTTFPNGTGGEPGGLIPVCCAPSAEEKKFIMEVFALLNQHRQSKGRAPLTYDDKLESAIMGHCHHMAAHGFFDHNAPENSVGDPWTRAEACGTSASGENIAVGQQSPQEVMDSWTWSPGHNANMLGDFTRVGIGFYAGGEWGTYWGQIFD
jgi:uncharacterized protein YkwD